MKEYKKQESTAQSLRIGLIQSNLQPKDHEIFGPKGVHDLYLNMSQEAVKRGAQWIVWSEGEFRIPFRLGNAKRTLRSFSQILNRPLLLGGADFQHTPTGLNVFNSALHVLPSGTIGTRYDKNILVPFGEYMPFEKYLHFIYKSINWGSRYSRGNAPVVHTIDGIPYNFLLCYEAIFPLFSRENVKKGSRLLINLTYDAWFGKTSAPYQHLMLASIRSAEQGVPMARLSTTGISTVINAIGEIGELSPLFKKKIVLQDIKLIYLPSLYTTIGDLFVWLCLALVCYSIGILFISHFRAKLHEKKETVL